jgi:hypothetical protein
MNGPPKKEGRVGRRAASEPQNWSENKSRVAVVQHLCGPQNLSFPPIERIWRRWEVEGGRLFRLFWTTADDRHLNAFAKHVRAMRRYGTNWSKCRE